MNRAEELHDIFPSNREGKSTISCRIYRIGKITRDPARKCATPKGISLQNSPPSVCLVRRCWKVLVRRGDVSLRWTHLSSSSCDLGVRWRSLLWFRPCLCLTSTGCWPCFTLCRWTSSLRRHRWPQWNSRARPSRPSVCRRSLSHLFLRTV